MATRNYAWAGQHLLVDLTSGTVQSEPFPDELKYGYIGGAGAAARVLWDKVPPEVDPLSPDAHIIYGTGLLVGLLGGASSSGRGTITARSPVTGLFGDSNYGGDFAPELKYAGYDQVIVTGRSSRPVYLWIDDDRVEIRDARHIWGKDIWEADSLIKQEHGDDEIKTLLIGIAGENQVKFANHIGTRFRGAGRTGHGCVAGSKNFKGIAVRGTRGLEVAHPEEFLAICGENAQKSLDMPARDMAMKYGMTMVIGFYNSLGCNTWKNWQSNRVPDNLIDKVTGETFVKSGLKVRDLGCFGCVNACCNWFEIREGKYAGEKGEKPEYDCVEGVGAQLGNLDLSSICYFQNSFNRLGMDYVEFGGALSMAMECYQRGILTREMTGGIALEWGDVDVIDRLSEMTARREGFGAILAEGAAEAARRIGPDAVKYAITCKNHAYVTEEERSTQCWALAFNVSTRGADHLKAMPGISKMGHYDLAEKLFGDRKAADVSVPHAKGRMVWWHENFKIIQDSLGICTFIPAFYFYGEMHPNMLAGMARAASGWDVTGDQLMEIGERVYQIERAYNARLGVTRKDDYPPERFAKEPTPDPPEGFVCHSDHPGMLDEYYDYRGADRNGLPTRDRLEEVGLTDVADDLERRGVLSPSGQKWGFRDKLVVI